MNTKVLDTATRSKTALDVIEGTIKRIFLRTISEYSFQHLHDAVYHLVQNGFGDVLYERIKSTFIEEVQKHVHLIANSIGSRVLMVLRDNWKRYDFSVAQTSDFLLFLNKQHCTRFHKATVRELGAHTFFEAVFAPSLLTRIQIAFVEESRKFRQSGGMDTSVLGDVATVLFQYEPSVFEKYVLQPFLHDLCEFHTSQASSKVSLTLAEFVESYNDAKEAEVRLSERCVGQRSIPKVLTALQEVWLIQFKDVLVNDKQLFPVLSSSSTHDLQQIFSAFDSVGESESVLQCAKSFITFEANVSCEDRTVLIQRLIGLLHRVKHLTLDVFASKKSEIFRHFEETVNRFDDVPEALAVVLDEKIRGSDSQLEEDVENVIAIFRFVREKDSFENSYKCLLAKRLLQSVCEFSSNFNDERDRLFVSHFRREVGCNMTSKVDGMFNDIAKAQELQQAFAASPFSTLEINCSVTVLTSGFWNPFSSLAFKLPLSMDRCMKAFSRFYHERHSNRRLTFCFVEGAVDLRMSAASRKYDLSVPPLFAVILSLFESDKAITASEVASSVEAPVGEVIKAMMGLSRSTVTHACILQSDSAGCFTSETKTWFNTDFRSKSGKFRVQAVAVRERAVKALPQPREDDRKFKVDAAIVRIMKSRRTLEHQLLVNEVQSVLKGNFAATRDEVKRRIEHLIDRDFLGRSAERHECYTYIA